MSSVASPSGRRDLAPPLVNCAAVAAAHALRCGAGRVAVVDVDLGHGWGTEEWIRAIDSGGLTHLANSGKGGGGKLFLYSCHLVAGAPPGWDDARSLRGREGAQGWVAPSRHGERDLCLLNVVNSPLHLRRCPARPDPPPRGAAAASPPPAVAKGAADCLSEDFRFQVTDRLLPCLRAFTPDMVIMVAGLSSCSCPPSSAAAASDRGGAGGGGRNPLCVGLGLAGPPGGAGAGDWSPAARVEEEVELSGEDYYWATKQVLGVCGVCCQGRLVVLAEQDDPDPSGASPPPPTPRSAAARAAGVLRALAGY